MGKCFMYENEVVILFFTENIRVKIRTRGITIGGSKILSGKVMTLKVGQHWEELNNLIETDPFQ